MRVYFLDDPLSAEDAAVVARLMKVPAIDQVRVPHVLPAPDAQGGHSGRPRSDDALMRKHTCAPPASRATRGSA